MVGLELGGVGMTEPDEGERQEEEDVGEDAAIQVAIRRASPSPLINVNPYRTKFVQHTFIFRDIRYLQSL